MLITGAWYAETDTPNKENRILGINKSVYTQNLHKFHFERYKFVLNSKRMAKKNIVAFHLRRPVEVE